MRGAGALERAEDGAALAPMSAEERRELAILARRAWAQQGRPGWADQPTGLPRELRLSQAEACDLWRHSQTLAVCGADGLKQCRHEDFRRVRAHFLRMVGREDAARRDEGAALTERRRQALAKLWHECREAGDVIQNARAYVTAIARSKFKTTLLETDLSAREIWQLVFHIRRAAQRRRREQSDVPF